MWIVIHDFCDLQDENYLYRAGDEFPRPGTAVNDIRIGELASGRNRLGVALIKEKPPAKGRKKKNAGTNPSDD